MTEVTEQLRSGKRDETCAQEDMGCRTEAIWISAIGQLRDEEVSP
jgi:hypothetical protein